jgi:pyridinium-3,5-biscarboxylic acid mononucleotide synthase
LGFASYTGIEKLDSHRKNRTGVIEAILADCKEPEDVAELARVTVAQSRRVLIMRVSPKHLEDLRSAFGEDKLEWNSRVHTAVIHNWTPVQKTGGVVEILSAGTADIPAGGRGSRYCLRNGLRNYYHI